MEELSNPQIRKLKALGQRMDASLKVGKQGLSPGFLATLDQELARHELVKVRLEEFKEQRKELAPELAAKSSAQLIALVGHVVLLYRQNPNPEQRKITL